MKVMLGYIGRRILQALPVFFGATLLIYALVFLMPGDPVQAMFGNKQPSAATLAMVRSQYHLDQPFIIQYLYFLKGLVTFDFGDTFAGRSIIEVIGTTLPNTLALGLLAFVIEAVLGVFLGVITGLKRGSFGDSFTLFTTLLLTSIPPLVLGFTLQYVLGVQLKILPATVGSNIDLQHLIMPAFVLATVSLATLIRLTRSSVSEVRGSDFVRTARAKGITSLQVNKNHILRNSLVPVVTYLGMDLVTLLSGAILTEAIFNVNGIGNKLYAFILAGEATAVVTIASLFLLFYIISNIVIDCLYALIDPRIRYGKQVS